MYELGVSFLQLESTMRKIANMLESSADAVCHYHLSSSSYAANTSSQCRRIHLQYHVRSKVYYKIPCRNSPEQLHLRLSGLHPLRPVSVTVT